MSKGKPASSAQAELSADAVWPDAIFWDRYVLASIDHPTLPWFEHVVSDPMTARAEPLGSRPWSERDALSILAQAAAHQALLIAVGIAESELDIDQWMVARKRGRDVRLIRKGAKAADSSGGIPPSEWLESLAEYLGLSELHVLEHAWFRADDVYAESVLRDAALASHDRQWLQRAGFASILLPSSDLRTVFETPDAIFVREGHSRLPFERIATLDPAKRIMTVGGEGSSILEPGSGLGLDREKRGLESDPEDMASRIMDDDQPVVWVESAATLDHFSRAVLDALRSASATLIIDAADRDRFPEPAARLGAPAYRVMAPSVQAARQIEERVRGQQSAHVAAFVTSPSYHSFLQTGLVPAIVPGPSKLTLAEPERSFLAAVAVAGSRVPSGVANRILASVGAGVTAESFASDIVEKGPRGELVIGDELREALVSEVPIDVRQSIAQLAAGIFEDEGDEIRGAEVLASNAMYRDAAAILARPSRESAAEAEIERILALIPATFVTGHADLVEKKGRAMIAQGRYDDALSILDPAEHPHLAAVAHRRQGNYLGALDLLGSLDDVASLVLRAEIQRLTGETDAASASLDQAESNAVEGKDRARIGFERFVLALDEGKTPSHGWMALDEDRYYADRALAYSLMQKREFSDAADAAERALAHAPDLPCEIDAAVDRFYAGFLSGDWSAAREHGRSALSRIERAQGDRASAGVLFTLAYLLADDGRMNQARRIIDKLDRFYAAHGDDRRRREIDLLRAQLALVEFELDHAARLAGALLQDGVLTGDLKAAAELLLHDAQWALGQELAPVSDSAICEELYRRQQVARSRLDQAALADGFGFSLVSFEKQVLRGASPLLPDPSTKGERRQLLRSLMGICQRGAASDHLSARAESLADELGVQLRIETPRTRENDALVTIASLELESQSQPRICGRDWLLATRNRLGRWIQVGTEQREEDLLDEWLENVPEAVTRLSPTRLFWVSEGESLGPDGLEAWAKLIDALAERASYKRMLEVQAASSESSSLVHESIIGASPLLLQSLKTVGLVSSRDIPVLVGGESGTGKELVARAIHKSSNRRSRPFVEVNCAALPEALVESEMFGHVRGAFTGAERDRIGLVEQAEGGTLFLDEIGEMPLAAQAKMLRLLQEGQYRRVGESATRTADVRVVAATNRDLASEVDAGRFREDLYYRIRGAEIHLPPLRERGDDIRLLAEHFLESELRDYPDGASRFSDEAASALESYEWPGNVRELAQVVRAAHAMAGQGSAIDLSHIPERIRDSASRRSVGGHYKEELERFRRELIQKALLATGGSMARAADRLGITRQALSYQARELGLRTSRTKQT